MKPASSTGPFFEVPGHTGPTGGGTMSERTRCNFCTLQDIKRREEKDGAQVIIRGNQGMLQPVVVYPDNSEKKIGAWFMELTDYCCC